MNGVIGCHLIDFLFIVVVVVVVVRISSRGWCLTLGGNMTLADLSGYVSSFKEPVNITLRNGNFTVYNPPPPSSGVVLDFILGILDGIFSHTV